MAFASYAGQLLFGLAAARPTTPADGTTQTVNTSDSQTATALLDGFAIIYVAVDTGAISMWNPLTQAWVGPIGGLTNPLATGVAPPALYAGDNTSGFYFDAGSNLPGLVDGPDDIEAVLESIAGITNGSPALAVQSDTSTYFGLVIQPIGTGTAQTFFEMDSAGRGPFHQYNQFNGTQDSPTATLTTNEVFTSGYQGYGTTGIGNGGVQINILAAEDFTDTANGVTYVIKTSSIGSATLASRFFIDGNGNTQIQNGLLIEPTIYSGSGASALPAASSGLAGARAFVSDGATVPTFMSAYAAGAGAVFTTVFCDGSSWLYG